MPDRKFRSKIFITLLIVSVCITGCYISEPEDPPAQLINYTEHHLIYFIFNIPEGMALDVDPCIKIEGHEDKIIKPNQIITLEENVDFNPGRRTIILLYNTRFDDQIGKMGTLPLDNSFDVDPCGEGMAPFYKYTEYSAGELRPNGFKMIIRG